MQQVDGPYRQLKDENHRLKRAVDELSILNDLATAIGGNLDSEKVMRTIISRSIRALDAEQGDITLISGDDHTNPQTLVRSMVNSSHYSPLHLNENLLGWMYINKKPLIINRPTKDKRFQHVTWDHSVRSLICTPLMVKSKLIGILTVYNKKENNEFSDADQRLLSIISAQSAQIVENVRLYEEEQAYKAVQKELELAAGIQRKLLPSESPDIKGYLIDGKNITAQSVGGDYFDFIEIGNSKLAVCLGDISGKGLTAAMLMSNLQAVLRGHIQHVGRPSEILDHANYQLFRSTDPEKFATLFLSILDFKKHTLTYSSAGHDFPFLITEIHRLTSSGIPLGIMENSVFAEETIELKPGDRIFVYSDGITDNMNKDEEEFGEKRLRKILLEADPVNDRPDKLIEKIFEASINHRGSKHLFDDMTALTLSRTQS